jgi:hypothetical protein
MRRLPDRWRAAMVTVMLFSQLGSALAPVACLAQAGSSPAAGAKTSKAPSGPTVQRGQEYYEQARFDEAITLLRDLVDRGQLSGDDLQKARELLARAYVKKGYPTQGKAVFKAILQDAPDWRPDPIRVPPDETAVFEQALKEFEGERNAPPPAKTEPGAVTPTEAKPVKEKTVKPPKPPKPPKEPKAPKPAKEPTPAASLDEGSKKSSKKLWYIVGGVAAVGLIAVVAGGGSKKSTPPAALAGFPPPPTLAR